MQAVEGLGRLQLEFEVAGLGVGRLHGLLRVRVRRGDAVRIGGRAVGGEAADVRVAGGERPARLRRINRAGRCGRGGRRRLRLGRRGRFSRHTPAGRDDLIGEHEADGEAEHQPGQTEEKVSGRHVLRNYRDARTPRVRTRDQNSFEECFDRADISQLAGRRGRPRGVVIAAGDSAAAAAAAR